MWNKNWTRRRRRDQQRWAEGIEARSEGGGRRRGRGNRAACRRESNCVRVCLCTHACACFVREVDGDWAIKGIITVLLRGTIGADANKQNHLNLSLCHLSLLGRQLQHSQYPHKIPLVCVCVSKNHSVSHCIFRRGGNLRWCEGDKAQGKRGKQKTLLEGSTFYLGTEWVARGLTAVFVFQMLVGKWAVVWIS